MAKKQRKHGQVLENKTQTVPLPQSFEDLTEDEASLMLTCYLSIQHLASAHGINLESAEFDKVSKDLNFYVSTVKDLDAELAEAENSRTDSERKTEARQVFIESSNPIEVLMKLHAAADARFEQAHKVVANRRLEVLDWASHPWLEAKDNSITISMLGLGHLDPRGLEKLYHCAYRIANFQQRYHLSDNALCDFFMLADSCLLINRHFVEKTRIENSAINLLRKFTPPR